MSRLICWLFGHQAVVESFVPWCFRCYLNARRKGQSEAQWIMASKPMTRGLFERPVKGPNEPQDDVVSSSSTI